MSTINPQFGKMPSNIKLEATPRQTEPVKFGREGLSETIAESIAAISAGRHGTVNSAPAYLLGMSDGTSRAFFYKDGGDTIIISKPIQPEIIVGKPGFVNHGTVSVSAEGEKLTGIQNPTITKGAMKLVADLMSKAGLPQTSWVHDAIANMPKPRSASEDGYNQMLIQHPGGFIA
jgi:hypothetical protein